MTNIVVLTGNGLSVALNSEFSLPNITKKFFDRLNPEHKAFIEHHMLDKNNKSDFEECIAYIEKFYDALHIHQSFFRNTLHGDRFIDANGLELSELMKHENSIRESIHLYMALILEIINGNVKIHQINMKLQGFVSWLTSIIKDENDVDLFTLNYDLLLETILLNTLDKGGFIEYYHQAGPWFAVSKEVSRYYFNPEKVKKNKKNCKTKLYHLHGSLSSFKDMKNNKIFKIKNEVIRKHNIYNRIADLDIVPSIITGGRKSDKIQETPYNFYYAELVKKMSDLDQLCEELFVIGYSFRDEHINIAIAERIKIATQSIDPRPLKLVIVDYATTPEDKVLFIRQINSALGLDIGAKGRFIENDSRVLFDGANSINCYSHRGE